MGCGLEPQADHPSITGLSYPFVRLITPNYSGQTVSAPPKLPSGIEPVTSGLAIQTPHEFCNFHLVEQTLCVVVPNSGGHLPMGYQPTSGAKPPVRATATSGPRLTPQIYDCGRLEEACLQDLQNQVRRYGYLCRLVSCLARPKPFYGRSYLTIIAGDASSPVCVTPHPLCRAG